MKILLWMILLLYQVTASIMLREHVHHPIEAYFILACEEVGCEWEGFFNSIPEKFDAAAGGLLPKFLRLPDTNRHAFFVEVPLNYSKPVPDGYEIADLPPCTYLYFNGMPYEDPNDFPIAIVNKAIENYPFERFGWIRSDDGPYLGMGAEPDTGARTAIPVKKSC